VDIKQAYFYQALQDRRSNERSLHDSFAQALEVCQINRSKDPQIDTLLDICHQTLDWVGAHGSRMAQHHLEPAYHNRQHFADICLALAIFLKEAEQLSEKDKCILLLAALTHDFGHRGLSFPPSNGTQEEETVRLLRDSPLSQLSILDREQIEDLIIGTTPANLNFINQRYLNEPNNKYYFMQSLLNDADIATSFIEPLTPLLSKYILMELGNSDPDENAIGKMIGTFKSHYRLTTSIAKSHLGFYS
jgi:3'5'-cyclic nucleotide phosphodiesterase